MSTIFHLLAGRGVEAVTQSDDHFSLKVSEQIYSVMLLPIIRKSEFSPCPYENKGNMAANFEGDSEQSHSQRFSSIRSIR